MSHSLFVLSSPTKLALSIQQLHIPFFPIHISAIILTQQTTNQVMKCSISIIFCIMIEVIELQPLSPPMTAKISNSSHLPNQALGLPHRFIILDKVTYKRISATSQVPLVPCFDQYWSFTLITNADDLYHQPFIAHVTQRCNTNFYWRIAHKTPTVLYYI